MQNNEYLRMAQKAKKDEREEMLTIKAHRIAGNASILFVSIMCLAVLIDGYIFNSNRLYDFRAVAFALLGVGAVNNMIFSLCQVITLKKYSRLLDLAVFGAVFVFSVVKCIQFFLV